MRLLIRILPAATISSLIPVTWSSAKEPPSYHSSTTTMVLYISGPAVHMNYLYAFTMKADMPGNPGRLRKGVTVAPSDILHQLLSHSDGVIGGLALVRTTSDGVGGNQKIHAHIGLRQIVALGQPGLEQDHGTAAIGHYLSGHPHLNVTGTGEIVHPLERVPGVHIDFFLLLKPGIHGTPFESHITSEIRHPFTGLGVSPRPSLRLLAAGAHRPPYRPCAPYQL